MRGKLGRQAGATRRTCGSAKRPRHVIHTCCSRKMDIVERYKNQLQDSTMTKRERSKKVNAIAEEAQFAHQTCRYTESLDKFSHLVALNETDPKYRCAAEATARPVGGAAFYTHSPPPSPGWAETINR